MMFLPKPEKKPLYNKGQKSGADTVCVQFAEILLIEVRGGAEMELVSGQGVMAAGKKVSEWAFF